MSNENNESPSYVIGSWLNDLPLTGPEDHSSSVNGSYEPGRDRLILGSGDGHMGADQPQTHLIEDFQSVDWSQQVIPDDGAPLESRYASADKVRDEALARLERTHSSPHELAEKQRLTQLIKERHTGHMLDVTALRLQRERNERNAAERAQMEPEREAFLNREAAKRADELEIEERARKLLAGRQ